jgi:hypothetical protein
VRQHVGRNRFIAPIAFQKSTSCFGVSPKRRNKVIAPYKKFALPGRDFPSISPAKPPAIRPYIEIFHNIPYANHRLRAGISGRGTMAGPERWKRETTPPGCSSRKEVRREIQTGQA